MSKATNEDRIQDTSLLFKNPFVSETKMKSDQQNDHPKDQPKDQFKDQPKDQSKDQPKDLKKQISQPKIEMIGMNRNQDMIKEANETIQDAYCYLKTRESQISLRSVSHMSIGASLEYILYYKIGHLFIRPMGVFSGIIIDYFYEIIPYSFRRSNGELDWLKYLANDLTLAYDYNFITGTLSETPNSIMIMANDNGKVFVFGEMYRGFVFGSPSTLELKGRLYMGQTSTDGSVKEELMKSSCIVEVNKGSMVVFICDFSHIIILPDTDCQMNVQALVKEPAKTQKKTKKITPKTPERKSKRKTPSRKKLKSKPKNLKISIRETTKTTTTTTGEIKPIKTETKSFSLPEKSSEKMIIKIPMLHEVQNIIKSFDLIKDEIKTKSHTKLSELKKKGASQLSLTKTKEKSKKEKSKKERSKKERSKKERSNKELSKKERSKKERSKKERSKKDRSKSRLSPAKTMMVNKVSSKIKKHRKSKSRLLSKSKLGMFFRRKSRSKKESSKSLKARKSIVKLKSLKAKK
uniref:Uncharacterized protein LOC113797613 n=1 Tax=Dermatophagoides pteronyssinus TaxID=6956 RepID=A0A6P6YF01_DERPT|nr:uncharacterized protein LOC113797613 [Dermatophagoides pteronyssinus]